MQLTETERRIVSVASSELGARLAAARVPEERWSTVAAALVVDLSQQAIDLSNVPAELERASERLARVLRSTSERPPAASGGR